MENEKKRRGILLVNLGSPDSTSVKDVRRYLNEFLMDGRVLDAPYLVRRFIVSAFILPFRPKKSAEAYEAIWWKEGSPLIVISERVKRALQKKFDMPVKLAMRYGNPSIKNGLQEMVMENIDEIILVPLYPHYAMSTIESVVVKAEEELAKLKTNVKMKALEPFYDHDSYIKALVGTAEEFLEKEYDYLLFSYHGVPERHLRKTDPTRTHCLSSTDCCSTPSPAHATCYRHQAYQTTTAFAKTANLPNEKYSVAFQSRLGRDPWLTPYTDHEIRRLAESGVRKLGVICPSFVSDCLETLEEIGIRGKEAFLESGGEAFELIPCLNDNPAWIDTLAGLIEEETSKNITHP